MSESWIPLQLDGRRYWKCPSCGRRVVAFSFGTDACPYDFCPFCFAKNGTGGDRHGA